MSWNARDFQGPGARTLHYTTGHKSRCGAWMGYGALTPYGGRPCRRCVQLRHADLAGLTIARITWPLTRHVPTPAVCTGCGQSVAAAQTVRVMVRDAHRLVFLTVCHACQPILPPVTAEAEASASMSMVVW